MSTILRQDFSNVRLAHQGDISDGQYTFEKCTFRACSVAVMSTATEHLRVRSITIDGCTITGGGLRGAWLTDCNLTNARVSGQVQILGCILERVSISGPMKKLHIHDSYSFVHAQQGFRDAAAAAYGGLISYAVDISDLACPDLDIRGIPSRLVRMNPDYHFVVARSDLVGSDWRGIDFSGTSFGISLGLLERSEWEDVILVVPRGSRELRARHVVEDLRRLGLTSGPTSG